jgi:hypothetical protein
VADARSDAELIARAGTGPEVFGVLFDRHFATITAISSGASGS